MSTAKKKPGGKRRRARIVVLSALYAHYTTGKDPGEVLSSVCEKEKLAADPSEFAKRLFFAAINNAEEIDRKISQAAANWSFERIAFVDKNILRSALAELLFLQETPPKTTINEAIELAREYSAEDSTRFVNGILDTVYHQEKGKLAAG